MIAGMLVGMIADHRSPGVTLALLLLAIVLAAAPRPAKQPEPRERTAQHYWLYRNNEVPERILPAQFIRPDDRTQ